MFNIRLRVVWDHCFIIWILGVIIYGLPHPPFSLFTFSSVCVRQQHTYHICVASIGMPLECRLERETNQISGLGRESCKKCKKACFLSFATYKNSYKKWYVSDMWNFVFFILSWDVLRVVLGSSSRKPPNHLKNRANPWLKTAMAASQGMQDQISNAMSTIEDVLGNLRWGGHFLHPQKKFAHCLGGAVFFRWGGRGWGWNHRGFPTGEPSHGIN